MAGSNAWGSPQSHIADSSKRGSVDGKAGLLFEVVHVIDDGNGTATIYNPNKSDYTTLEKATTGAAILSDIKFAEFIAATHINATTNTYSTTVSLGPVTVNLINGPTTVAVLQWHQKSTTLYHRVLVVGKTF